MGFNSFFSAITKPDERIAELIADKSQAESIRPGLIWVAWVQVIYGTLLLGVAFAFLAVLALLGATLGPRFMAFFGPLLLAGGLLTPFALVVWTLKAWAVAVLASLGGAWMLETIMVKLAGAKGGRHVLVFNVMTKILVPWQVFVVIPILGWVVMAVGMVFNVFRAIKQLYETKDTGHQVLGVIGYYATSTVGTVLAAALVGLLTTPLATMDPMAGWANAYKSSVFEQMYK